MRKFDKEFAYPLYFLTNTGSSISEFNTKQELTLFLAEEPKEEYSLDLNLKKVKI